MQIRVECVDKSLVNIKKCLLCKDRKCKLLDNHFNFILHYPKVQDYVTVTEVISCPIQLYLKQNIGPVYTIEGIKSAFVGSSFHSLLSKTSRKRPEFWMERRITPDIRLIGKMDDVDFSKKIIYEYKTSYSFYSVHLDQSLLYLYILEPVLPDLEVHLIYLENGSEAFRIPVKKKPFEKRLDHLINQAKLLYEWKTKGESFHFTKQEYWCQYCHSFYKTKCKEILK